MDPIARNRASDVWQNGSSGRLRNSPTLTTALRLDDRCKPPRLPTGVYQGQDLYDSRVSLIQYSELFNAFPNLPFSHFCLGLVTNQELVDYAWIFQTF